MHSIKRSVSAACGIAVFMMWAFAARADVVYRENFPATSGMTPFTTFTWNAYYGNAATNATVAPPGSTGNPANAMISGGPGAPTAGPNINAGASAQTTNGFAPILTQNGGQDFLIYTDEFAIDRTTSAPTSFTWYAGSYYAGDTHRAVIRIGTTWYASNTPLAPVAFGNASGGQGFGPAAQQLVSPFSDSASAWKTLNFTPGSPLTLGADLVAPLPGGPITAFGIFAEIADSAGPSDERTFLDTYEVNAVPEPAAAAIFFGAASLALASRRRA
jgi:hypothetical protein